MTASDLQETLYIDDGRFAVHLLVVGPLDNNVWIVRSKRSGEAVLVDAANEHERLLPLCRSLSVRRVVETHGHADHIQAVPAIRDAGIDVAIGGADAGMLQSYDSLIEDGDVISLGDSQLVLRAVHTPGHTPGSVSFALEADGEVPIVFTGDTLFPGGPGATKFPGGDFPAIISSIEDRLFARYGPDTKVLPGHGKATTMGAEAPHLAEWVARGW